MFSRFNHHRKCEWSTDTYYNVHEHWTHPKWKKPLKKNLPRPYSSFVLEIHYCCEDAGKSPGYSQKNKNKIESEWKKTSGQVVKVEGGPLD